MIEKKRPKDMTREELAALPIYPWGKPMSLSKTGMNGDDIVAFVCSRGIAWTLTEDGDGNWYKDYL